MDNNTLHADVLVIGFGKGGKVAAATLGQLGKRVVLVEQIGPDVRRHLPERRLRSDQGAGAPLGQRGDRTTRRRNGSSTPSVRSRRSPPCSAPATTRHSTAPTRSPLITGAAPSSTRTPSPWARDDRLTITAETILINTGSSRSSPDVPGLRDSSRLLTSTDLIKNTDAARAGWRSSAAATSASSSPRSTAGSAPSVTVFESAARILGREDDDVAAAAEQHPDRRRHRHRRGRDTSWRSATARPTRPSSTKRTAAGTPSRSTPMLAATGRAPGTDGLGLDEAGVRTTSRGAVEVDEYLRTSQPHIFALGDVNGGPQFTYISLDDSRIVLDQLVGEGKRSTTDRVAVPAHPVHDPAARHHRPDREAGARGRLPASRSPARTSPTSSRCPAPTSSRRPAA